MPDSLHPALLPRIDARLASTPEGPPITPPRRALRRPSESAAPCAGALPQSGRRSLLAGLLGTLAAGRAWPAHAPTPADALQVLHWWTSPGERAAASALARRLEVEHVHWIDAAVPGGAGIGALKVLKGRFLAGDAPEVTQIIGTAIGEWASMGLLLELDELARDEHWDAVLFPTISALVRHGNHVVAAPLGIHRVNSLLCNRAVFSRLRLSPPASWDQFERVLLACSEAGIPALEQSGEPWQVAQLFEPILLATGGPALHHAVFASHDEAALQGSALIEALERLRLCQKAIRDPGREFPWSDGAYRLGQGGAAMMVMGDWAKAELQHAGARLGADFDCLAFPGTEPWHLYSVDTLAMMAGDFSHAGAQRTLARLIVSRPMQDSWSTLKGAVSVRRDADPARMDGAARASWSVFARGAAAQVPSLVHRMLTDETGKDAIIAELHRYYLDDSIAPAALAQRLRAIFRAIGRPDAAPPDAPVISSDRKG